MTSLAQNSAKNNTSARVGSSYDPDPIVRDALPGRRSVGAPGSAPAERAVVLETLGNKSGGSRSPGGKWAQKEQTPEQAREARRKHRAWEYRQVVRSLRACDRDDLADQVAACGRLRVYECGSCEQRGARRVYTCKSRLCPYCLQSRAERIARKLVDLVGGFANPVVMVLTVKNRLSLEDVSTHLRESFQRLRDRVSFKRSFVGGVCFWESTFSDEFGWHAHLHCLVDGYMEHADLKALWHEVTGDSFIVHLSYIAPEGRREAVLEACKYPCKLSSIVTRPELVQEYLDHTKGRRLYWAFGTAYKALAELASAEDAEDEEVLEDVSAEACPHCGTLGDMRPVFSEWHNVTWSLPDCWRVKGGWYVNERVAPGVL